MASGVAPPCFSYRRESREPALTPMRMGTPRSFASEAMALMWSGLRMLPGLRRRQCTPASRAASPIRQLLCTSATMGTGERGTMRARPSAASSWLHVHRTMSAPAPARA